MARALGFAPGQQDAWSKQMDMWGTVATMTNQADPDIPDAVLTMAAAIEDIPATWGFTPAVWSSAIVP